MCLYLFSWLPPPQALLSLHSIFILCFSLFRAFQAYLTPLLCSESLFLSSCSSNWLTHPSPLSHLFCFTSLSLHAPAEVSGSMHFCCSLPSYSSMSLVQYPRFALPWACNVFSPLSFCLLQFCEDIFLENILWLFVAYYFALILVYLRVRSLALFISLPLTLTKKFPVSFFTSRTTEVVQLFKIMFKNIWIHNLVTLFAVLTHIPSCNIHDSSVHVILTK